MFLLIVIIILIAATSILGNIYAGIFSFQQNYGDLNNYSNSYYAAISSIERGLLVSKYKAPSFVGSGGFISTGFWGETSELFSGDFGSLNHKNNGLYWQIDSQCNNITGTLKNDEVLTINFYGYNELLGNYIYDSITSSSCIKHGGVNISGHFNNSPLNLNNGNVHWEINDVSRVSGFVIGSGDTMIDYSTINNSNNIFFDTNTIDPSSASPIGNTICDETGCYSGQTISDFLEHNSYMYLYVKDELLSNNNQRLGSIKYNFYANHNTANCSYYNINGVGKIGKYKQELSIKKPTFNYKNPNRKKFIFPYYN